MKKKARRGQKESRSLETIRWRIARREHVELQHLRKCDCEPWRTHKRHCPEAGVNLKLLSQELIEERIKAREEKELTQGQDFSESEEVSWITCTSILEKDYPPHEGDAWLDDAHLTFEVFLGKTVDDKKAQLRNFKKQFCDYRGKCDPDRVVKWVMQERVGDFGPDMLDGQYPYLADEYLNECMDLIYMLDP